MRIKVWGCRGSLPTPGRHTTKYGGNTTCLEVRLDDGTLIILDAGSGIRELGHSLLQEQNLSEIYLFLTHAHWDHLMGFPFFRPAYLSQYKINVRGGPRAKETLNNYLEHQMQPPYFPVPFGAMQAQFDFTFGPPQAKQSVGSAEIWSIALNHPNGGYGFKIIEGDNVFVFLPDNELDFAHYPEFTRQTYVDFCQGASLLMHDAQYTDEEYHRVRGWGHTRLSSTIELGLEAGVEQLGLFHHDPERSDDDLDTIVLSAQAKIAQAGRHVDCFAVQEGMEITIWRNR